MDTHHNPPRPSMRLMISVHHSQGRPKTSTYLRHQGRTVGEHLHRPASIHRKRTTLLVNQQHRSSAICPSLSLPNNLRPLPSLLEQPLQTTRTPLITSSSQARILSRPQRHRSLRRTRICSSRCNTTNNRPCLKLPAPHLSSLHTSKPNNNPRRHHLRSRPHRTGSIQRHSMCKCLSRQQRRGSNRRRSNRPSTMDINRRLSLQLHSMPLRRSSRW